VQLLIDHEAEVNAVDKSMQTAILWAALRGNTETVRILIKHRADVNAEDANGWTPLRWAESKGHAETVALLKESGAH
jgi:ankyrin repeat protein